MNFSNVKLTPYFFVISPKGVFEMSAGLGCDTNIDLIFIFFFYFKNVKLFKAQYLD